MNRITLQPNRSRRGGFTLIELMVVISIILILVGVSIAGISQVAKHSKTQRTQTALETARSLMAGYAATDHTQSALKTLYAAGTPGRIGAAPYPNLLDQGLGTLIATIGANGETHWQKIQANSDQLAKNIDYTSQVMALLLRVPENRAIMDKLPAESKFILLDQSTNLPLNNVAPLLADGNGEPILFVPPAGMSAVSVANGPVGGGILQSDGRVHVYPPAVDPYPNPLSIGFFASAGSDRDFTKGDDNAYSFHQ